MDERKFNNYMHIPLEKWVADILGMEHNLNNGPDLFYNHEGDQSFIETKWALVPDLPIRTRYPKAWTVDEKQMEYPKNWGKGYWGLGLYTLDRAVADIDQSDIENLDNFVTYREFWIVRWNWMDDNYKPSHTSGKTKRSEWDTHLRYPKLKDIPKTKHLHEVEGGKIHITSYVPNDYFFPEPSPQLESIPF